MNCSTEGLHETKRYRGKCKGCDCMTFYMSRIGCSRVSGGSRSQSKQFDALHLSANPIHQWSRDRIVTMIANVTGRFTTSETQSPNGTPRIFRRETFAKPGTYTSRWYGHCNGFLGDHTEFGRRKMQCGEGRAQVTATIGFGLLRAIYSSSAVM